MKKCTISLLRIFLLLSFLTAFLLVSCGTKTIGDGVVLWSDDESSIKTGSVVQITDESKIDNVYTVLMPDDSRKKIAIWRIDFFNRKKDADKFRKKYTQYAPMLAIAQSDGLPVREDPDSSSQRIYKLRKNETIKILEKQAQKATEGTYENYWYKVLTDNGTTGWCFGEALLLTEIGNEGDLNQAKAVDPLLDNFLHTIWRPEYFRPQIRDGYIDLEKINANIGLFPDPEQHMLKIVTDQHEYSFSYKDIIPAGNNLYVFQGSSVRLTIRSMTRVVIEYPAEGKYFLETYITIPQDIGSIVDQEMVRRDNLFKSLTKNGNTLVSDAYGTITLESVSKFTWKNNWRLVPDIIPANAGTEGKIDFSVFIDPSLRGQYDGALAFTFINKKEIPVVFLFKVTDSGIKFVFVPQNNIEHKVIQQEPSFPIVIFFNSQGE